MIDALDRKELLPQLGIVIEIQLPISYKLWKAFRPLLWCSVSDLEKWPAWVRRDWVKDTCKLEPLWMLTHRLAFRELVMRWVSSLPKHWWLLTQEPKVSGGLLVPQPVSLNMYTEFQLHQNEGFYPRTKTEEASWLWVSPLNANWCVSNFEMKLLDQVDIFLSANSPSNMWHIRSMWRHQL